MNIMIIASDNNCYHGAFLSMASLASLLQERYHHRVIVVLPREGTGEALLDEKGIRHILIRSYSWVMKLEDRGKARIFLKDLLKRVYNVRASRRIADLIRREHTDLVHINTTFTCVGARAAQRTGTPFVWHLREFLEEDQSRRIRFRRRGYRLMQNADRIAAISQSIYQKYRPIFGEEKLSVIYNGIEPGDYDCPEHEIFQEKEVCIVFVGGLYEHKRPSMAVQACVLLRQRGYEDFKLRLVGTGGPEEESRLRDMIRDAGAGDYIEMCGAAADPVRFYRTADIALVCSRMEAFGRVTVEAMFAGALVIGADSAGTAELIRDGDTGLLYDSDDVASLADRMEYALLHRQEMRETAKRGRIAMLKNMTAAKNAELVNELYLSIMNERAFAEQGQSE
ncbi:MAG: glycosyltransferase family 4 protein [Clostridiales bacterium]|nr:glycosyltransferase family 4 protein [Clostridiales bacterium]